MGSRHALVPEPNSYQHINSELAGRALLQSETKFSVAGMPSYNSWLQTGACAVEETESPECAAYKASAVADSVEFPEPVSPEAPETVFFEAMDGNIALNCTTNSPTCRVVTPEGALSGESCSWAGFGEVLAVFLG